MSNNNWPGKPGVPLNPARDGWHWLTRKNGLWPEAWRWNPDADGRGAWAETDCDGQPEEMVKWYRYIGPCLTPAEVDARVQQAKRDALEEAARRILIYFNNNHIAQNTAAAIRALKGEGDE